MAELKEKQQTQIQEKSDNASEQAQTVRKKWWRFWE